VSAAPEIRSPEDIIADALRPDTHERPTDVEIGTGWNWEISDTRAADWAIAKIRQEHRACDDETFTARVAIDALDAERARLAAFVADREEQRDRTCSFFEGKLTAYLRLLRLDDPKRTSLKLSGGTIKSRAARDRVEIDDLERVAEIAAVEGFDFGTFVPQVNKVELLKHIKATGDVPDGARLIVATDDDRTFTVEVAR
jgi:hypothetical protein